jgi:hypothetical protein
MHRAVGSLANDSIQQRGENMGFFSKLFQWDDKAQPISKLPASELGLDAKATANVLAELDIDNAIAAHENWKIRLNNQIAGTSTEKLDPELICLDDRCDLGKWLHGPGRERLGKYPSFSVLVARHKYFHVQASTVAAHVQAGDKDAAEKALNGPFKHGSSQVVLLLKELKRGLGG